MTDTKQLKIDREEVESIYSTILAKGRVTVWIILGGSFICAALGVFSGDQVLETVKYIGALWLGGELGARKS